MALVVRSTSTETSSVARLAIEILRFLLDARMIRAPRGHLHQPGHLALPHGPRHRRRVPPGRRQHRGECQRPGLLPGPRDRLRRHALGQNMI